MFDKITEYEEKVMRQWIKETAFTNFEKEPIAVLGPTEHILAYWIQNKEKLYKLLGENLIVRKMIDYSKPIDEIKTDIARCADIQDFLSVLKYNLIEKSCFCANSYLEVCEHVLSANALAHNHVLTNVALYNKDQQLLIKLPKGMRTSKAVKKLMELYPQDEKKFEKFRLAHSKVLTGRNYKCELCLSIHPLDYMTMSDNAHNWSSCMSWGEGGAYRGGTLECMNSTNTLVAYLHSPDEKYYLASKSDLYWNDKKWRCLFIADEYAITSVKDYPYHNEGLLKITLDWVRELAKENWGMEYGKTHSTESCDISAEGEFPISTFSYWTRQVMYNDFGRTTHYYALSGNQPKEDCLYYTDVCTCALCGSPFNTGNEADVVCESCSPRTRCDSCGCVLEASYTGDDHHLYCEECFYDRYFYNDLTGEYSSLNDYITIDFLFGLSSSCNN